MELPPPPPTPHSMDAGIAPAEGGQALGNAPLPALPMPGQPMQPLPAPGPPITLPPPAPAEPAQQVIKQGLTTWLADYVTCGDQGSDSLQHDIHVTGRPC